MAKEELIDRGRMLLKSQQLEARASSGQNEAVLPPKLVMEFCISLVQEVHNPDLLWIAADIAKHRSGATNKQRDILLAHIHRMKRMRR